MADGLLGRGVELVDADDARPHARLLTRSFEVHELDQADRQEDRADRCEHKEGSVERVELVVGGGAQARSVEWICPRVVKAVPERRSRCHNAHGAARANASTSTSRKGSSSAARTKRRR